MTRDARRDQDSPPLSALHADRIPAIAPIPEARRVQTTSATPWRVFSWRAITKSRSESRFRQSQRADPLLEGGGHALDFGAAEPEGTGVGTPPVDRPTDFGSDAAGVVCA